MTQPTNLPDYIAIDISKSNLQIQDERRAFVVAHTAGGHRKLLDYLKTLPNALAVFEASGGYERNLIERLREANIAYAMINPARLRDFARSEGVRAKTDPIDSKMILAFAKSKALSPTAPPSQASLTLAALMDRRDHLTEQLACEKNRLHNSSSLIHPSIKRVIGMLKKEVAALEKIIAANVKKAPELNARFQIMASVKGVGKVTAWTLLAYFSELEKLKRNQATALAGIAPFNRDSGKCSAKRSIQGGRAKVRKCLYMAAHTAASCNPVINSYVTGLRQRGKPYKCAIVAAMRKLLLHLQSLLKNAHLSPC
jgi:transposase